jgi:hypothetical protein
LNATKKSLLKFKGHCKVYLKIDSDSPIEVLDLIYVDYAHPNYIFSEKKGGKSVLIKGSLILKMEVV